MSHGHIMLRFKLIVFIPPQYLYLKNSESKDFCPSGLNS